MTRKLWIAAAAVVLALSLRVNLMHNKAGGAVCLMDPSKAVLSDFCDDNWIFSLGLKYPWSKY